MADAYTSTLPTVPVESINAGLIPEDVFGVSMNYYPNRHILYTRFPHAPVGSSSFRFTNENFRPRSVNLTTTINNSITTLVVADSSFFDVDDLVKVEDEIMIVTGKDAAAKTITVIRAYAGTSAASHTVPSLPAVMPVYLLTNTRTGAAKNIPALSRKPTSFTQWLQTTQHAYSTGGALNAKTNYGPFATPLQRDKQQTLFATLDDFEFAMLYGVLIPGDSGTAPKPAMAGIDNLLVTNRTKAPTNANAYTPYDLVRDTFQRCCDAGGAPTHLLVSSDFLSGFAKWKIGVIHMPSEANELNVAIARMTVSFLPPNVEVVMHPLLRPGTAIALQDDEVAIRMAREVFDKPRGSAGDAFEGDIIMEGAIELDNEAHAAMVSGITAFSAG